MRTEFRLLLLTVCLPLFVAGSAAAQNTGVGQVSFPNSGAAAAQQDFLTGLAQLHNFEYGPAAEFFRKAQQTDPTFAMAYWGEAMTHTHPVWMEQDAAAARAILQRLGPTADARLAKAKTEREQDYLRAVEVLYGDGEKKARDIAFADAMAAVHRKYPDDVEAAAFTALALLGTAHDGRDFAIYMRSAAILEPLFPANQKHPGIAHYLIHSYDDPVHAPLGLRAAREYSKIAPTAAHAQHMCSHIFVAMGMWDDVVEANEAAVKITRGVAAAPTACGHYPFWLTYGYLQQGRTEAAKTMVKECHESVRTAKRPLWGSVIGMRTRYLLDTEEWSGEIASLTASPTQPVFVFGYEFTNAFSAIRRGDLAAARAALAKMREARQSIEASAKQPADPAHADMPGMNMPPPDAGSLGRLKILHDEILGLIRHKEGAHREAIDLVRAAAALEDTLPFEFGPPFIDKPAYELLGEILLETNQPKDARAAFEKALARTPNRTTPLVGLMKAAAQSGDRAKEAEIRSRLLVIWRRADRKPTDPPLFAQAPPEDVTFKSGSLTLHGSIWRPAGAGRFPAVLYNHGSEKPVDYLAALGPLFTRRGYLLFVPERRGHGRSGDQGRWISDILREDRAAHGNDAYAKTMVRLLETEHLDDQLAALAYLKSRKDVDPIRIAIAGCSFGGIQTLLAAERNTGARAGVNFAGAAITWDRSPIIAERLRAAARRAMIPVFFVQAENDYNTAPSRELSAEMQKVGKPHEMKIFPPFGTTPEEAHTPFCANGGDLWAPDVFRFLERHLQ